jgi:hypothetical protein
MQQIKGGIKQVKKTIEFLLSNGQQPVDGKQKRD